MRILYNSKDKKFKSKFGTLQQNEGCSINIHIPESCNTSEVTLIFKNEDMSFHSAYSMKKTSEYDLYEIYSCDISLASAGLYFYYFLIKTQNEEFSLFKQGYDMTNMEDGEYWQLSCIPKEFYVPDCFQGKIMYQIFPDRFCKIGDVCLDGKLLPFNLHESFDELPEFLPDEKGIIQNNDFFGGNIQGIISKLDYLKSLNVGVIYLNPIFKAYSNHRYDTADYLKIDEMLGTEENFAELCSEAHKRNIKIILDGVFSHTGSNSVYFDSENVFGNGALSDPSSPFREWYDFKNYPNEYTSWWGINTLPCVDENNKSYRDFIINNSDSVVSHWIKLGADGFRLDVADELPDSFIFELRKKMKSLKKESLLIGEVWEDASNKISYGVRRRYFTSGELDSVMNYPFKNAIIDFCLGKDNGLALRDVVMTIAENYPQDVLNSLMNILSTHDTVRALTALGTTFWSASKQDRAVYKLNDTERNLAEERLKCAFFLACVLPGMPCIYYGDEIGTEGFEDPFCRSFFNWSRIEDNMILTFYREMTSVKVKFDVLKYGNVDISVIDNGLISVKREYNNNTFVAYINTSDLNYVCEINGKIIMVNNADLSDNTILIHKYGFFCSID